MPGPRLGQLYQDHVALQVDWRSERILKPSQESHLVAAPGYDGSARMWSLVTRGRHGLVSQAYLRDLFRVLPHWPNSRYLELCSRVFHTGVDV